MGIVALGSLWAGYGKSRASIGSPQLSSSEEPGEDGVITTQAAALFVVFASAALLFMFFFLNQWIAALFTGLLSIMMWQASTIATSTFFTITLPTDWYTARISFPFTRTPPVPLLDLAALAVSSGATGIWIYLHVSGSHWAWILQDYLCGCLVLLFLAFIRIPNIKVASILLGSALCYDVFWVFLQPILFGGASVMVEVATGGISGARIPILFEVPRFNGLGTNPAMGMLGLGDVVLPGLVVALAMRWDIYTGRSFLFSSRSRSSRGTGRRSQRSPSPSAVVERKGIGMGYFLPAIVAYGVGLLLTFIALVYSWGGDQGQPALLYLVPCTMLTVVGLGWFHGELKELWTWDESEEDERRRRERDLEAGGSSSVSSISSQTSKSSGEGSGVSSVSSVTSRSSSDNEDEIIEERVTTPLLGP